MRGQISIILALVCCAVFANPKHCGVVVAEGGHPYPATARLAGTAERWEVKIALEKGEFPTSALVPGRNDHEFLLGTNRRLVTWQARSGSIREGMRTIYPVRSVSYSRATNVVAIKTDDGHTRLLDMMSAECLGSFPVHEVVLSPRFPESLLVFPQGTENLVTQYQFRQPGQVPVFSQPVDVDDLPNPLARAAYLSGGDKLVVATTPDFLWIYEHGKIDVTFATAVIPEADGPIAVIASQANDRFAVILRTANPIDASIDEFLVQVYRVPATNPGSPVSLDLKPELQVRLERPVSTAGESVELPPVAFTEHRFLVGATDGSVAVFNLDEPQQNDSFRVGEKIWNLALDARLGIPPSPVVALASGLYHGYFAAARADGRVVIWGADHNHAGGGERGVVTEPLPGVVESLHFKIGTHQAVWASVRKADGSYAYYRYGISDFEAQFPVISP